MFIFPPRTAEQRLLWEIVFLCVIIVAVGFFGRLASEDVFYTVLLTITFSINIVLRFILVNENGDWAFFLLGVLGGGGNDLMSMVRGVYSYTSVTIIPILDGLMPLWMILFWGQVFLVFRKVFNLRWFKGVEFKKDGQFVQGWVDTRLVVDILLLIFLRIVIYSTYWMAPWLPAAIYAVGIGSRLVILPLRKNEWMIVGILPLAFGFEGLMVTFGLYKYINPAFLGMPAWLLLWWVLLVPCVVKEIFDRVEFGIKTWS